MRKLMIAAALLFSTALVCETAFAVQLPLAPVVAAPKKTIPPVTESDDIGEQVHHKPLRFHHAPKLKCKAGFKPFKGVCHPQTK